jgi:hypothetical protein
MIRDLQSQIEELKRKLQSNEGGAFSVVKYFACARVVGVMCVKVVALPSRYVVVSGEDGMNTSTVAVNVGVSEECKSFCACILPSLGVRLTACFFRCPGSICC